MDKSDKNSTNKAVTIYDIAKEAGVSPATVSRVLTGSTNVKEDKKEKILHLIEKYDFRPNALARGLSDTKSRVIGIIAADVRNPYYAAMFLACEMAAKEIGYTVLLCNSLSAIDQEIKQLETLQEQRVDVIIQLGGAVDDLVSNVDYVERVNRVMDTIPVVVTGKLDGTKCYQVQIDAMYASELLLEHLIGLGHRDIALVGGSMRVSSTYEKYQQYLKTLRKHRIDFKEEYIAEGGYDYQSGYDGMSELFSKHIIPTAVIAINDFSAAGVLRCILDNGYHVPEDISIVSYDNTMIAELLIPKLTSIDYKYTEFGKKLIDTAVAAVNKQGDIPMLQRIDSTLVVRESSGPVRK